MHALAVLEEVVCKAAWMQNYNCLVSYGNVQSAMHVAMCNQLCMWQCTVSQACGNVKCYACGNVQSAMQHYGLAVARLGRKSPVLFLLLVSSSADYTAGHL